MARLVPADLICRARTGAHEPALATLADALGDDHTVFLRASVMVTTPIPEIPEDVSRASIVGTRLRGSA